MSDPNDFKENWDDKKPRTNLSDNLQMSRGRFLLTNGIYATIGFLVYYIFLG